MNFIKIIDILSNDALLNTKGSRRDSFQQFKNVGKNVALASIPFALASVSEKTRAATNSMSMSAMMGSNEDVLKFALTLEYLESEYYQMGLDSGIIPESEQTVFSTISKHENAHVTFLLAALGLQDGDLKPVFDFSGAPGGLTLDPFNHYPTFMALAQGFEDTGVRAYKGQAGALANSNELLTYALQIHSVEARHASEVRRMRGEKGWITKSENTLPAAFAGIYEGATPESNTIQGGVDLSGMFNSYGGDNAVTEAFDEPLTMAEVLAIGGVFIVA